MPVILNHNQLLQNQQNLYRFLLGCQRTSREQENTQIVSISWKIESVDPLAVFNVLARSNQLSFYFEKQELGLNGRSRRKTAIAAIDAVVQFHTEGEQRFNTVKTFVHSTLASTSIAGDWESPLAGPNFFCSFSFTHYPRKTVFSGFPGATVFLPKWQVSCHEGRCVVVANLALDSSTNLETTVSYLWQKLQTIRAIQHEFLQPSMQHLELFTKQDVEPIEHFKQSVSSALKSIQTGLFHKVVLAHAIDVTSPLPLHHTNSLNNLRRLYPDCYIFSVGNGEGQYFIGASPERLVCLQQGQLATDALAGSAPRGQTTSEDARLANALLNSSKESREHQVVVDFITRQLTQLGLEPQSASLRLLQLSNIQHLHTPIRAAVPDSVHLFDILAKLHPTPAVAGLPRDTACEQIRQYESFERSLYAAPIGWVNHNGDGEFAVGIRSALIQAHRARLFAGAGIVAGSDPEQELLEVQLKLQVLLAALV